MQRKHGRATIGIGLAAVIVAGCTFAPPKKEYSARFQGMAKGTRREVVASQMFELAQRSGGVIVDAADKIETLSDDPQIRRNALLWKMNAIPAWQMACYRLEPVAGHLDSWVLAVQMREFLTEGAGRDLFGPHQEIAITAASRLEEDAEEIARRIAADDESFDRYADIVYTWAATQPIQSLTFARESIIPLFADMAGSSASAIEAAMAFEGIALNLTSRVRNYTAHLPRQVRWQGELLQAEILESDTIQGIATDLDGMADALERGAAIAEQTQELVQEERTALVNAIHDERMAVLDAVGDERVAVLAAVSEERATVMGGVREERIAVMEEIDRQRLATLDALSQEIGRLVGTIDAEREAIIDELRKERQAMLQGLEQISVQVIADTEARLAGVIDHFFWRGIQVAIAALILLAILARLPFRVFRSAAT